MNLDTEFSLPACDCNDYEQHHTPSQLRKMMNESSSSIISFHTSFNSLHGTSYDEDLDQYLDSSQLISDQTPVGRAALRGESRCHSFPPTSLNKNKPEQLLAVNQDIFQILEQRYKDRNSGRRSPLCKNQIFDSFAGEDIGYVAMPDESNYEDDDDSSMQSYAEDSIQITRDRRRRQLIPLEKHDREQLVTE